jgi:predicted nucleotidyltransferase
LARAPADILAEMVRRIVELADPDKIILFGSRARGDAGPHSDYDLLIIAPSHAPRWKRTGRLYVALAGSGVSKDIVWWTPEEADAWRNVKSHFITTAIREGKVLYERTH